MLLWGMYLGPGYLLIIGVTLVISIFTSLLVKTTFNKYSRRATTRGFSGAQVARRILDRAGLQDVAVEPVQGFLSDHYDPRSRVLRLSPQVYQSNSIAALGVATRCSRRPATRRSSSATRSCRWPGWAPTWDSTWWCSAPRSAAWADNQSWAC